MKQHLNNTLGLSVSVEVPENSEEFDKLAGRPGACVDEANRNVLYRGWNHEFRATLCEELAKETGVERKTKTVGEGDNAKEVPAETEKVYYNRLIAEGHIDTEKAQEIATRIAPSIKFDPAPAQRSKKAPKEIEAAATNILAAIEAGQTDEATVKSKIAKALEIEDFDAVYGEELSQETLVAALVADKEKQDRERNARFV